MHSLVAGILVVVAILFVAGVLTYILQLAANALKVVGTIASSSRAELGAALVFMKSWTARKIGRADYEGEEVEVFEPRSTVALPTALDRLEEREYKQQLLSRARTPDAPRITVPTFPDIPDVLRVPEVKFNSDSSESLSSEHIPSLLDGRSPGCSVPTELHKPVMHSDLQIAAWMPSNAFPQPPKAPLSGAVAKTPIGLRLPLYAVREDASALRLWFTGKLNAIVRGVHHKRILAFEQEKANAQAEYDRAMTAKALGALRYKVQTDIWAAVKAATELERRTAVAAHQDRAAKSQATYRDRRERFEADFSKASERLSDFWRRVEDCQPEAVCRLFNIAIARIVTPLAFPRDWSLEYDREHKILILDLRLPDFERIEITKKVALKRETKTKPVSARERKQFAEMASCLYLLRAIHEIAHHDVKNAVQALTINGWVEYIDATTGRDRSIVIVSIFAEMEQLRSIDLSRVDPVKCIRSLGGRFAGIEHGYVAIAPIVRLNRHDDRLIEGTDVLSNLVTGTNLAAMPWDKFEHLIRQLFEKVFAGPGIEVKVTRASRDRGVDAIIFDPDPIRGGKTVIQAKRYANTVDLSAVRDLYGTVVNEGANKGILVTTSSFGPDAYEFSKDKNLTLLTGRELLGLLEKHGYQYRIDLEEARKLQTLTQSESHSTAVR